MTRWVVAKGLTRLHITDGIDTFVSCTSCDWAQLLSEATPAKGNLGSSSGNSFVFLVHGNRVGVGVLGRTGVITCYIADTRTSDSRARVAFSTALVGGWAYT